MLDAAIQESLNTAREERDVAADITDANASSSRLKGARNKAAALLAAAAEEGLELAEDQDSDFKDDLSDESEAESDGMFTHVADVNNLDDLVSRHAFTDTSKEARRRECSE